MRPPRMAVAALVATAALAGAAPAAANVTIAWGGDLTLGSSYGRPPDRGWPQLAPVAGVLGSADLAAVNYEGTFAPGGGSKCGGSSGGNCFAFQAPAANAATLTRAALERAGVGATGAPGEVRVLRTAGGVRVAFVGFSSYSWSAAINDDRQVDALVREAGRRADLVVAFFHGGAEGSDRLHVPHGHEHAFGEDRGNLRRFAHRAIDAGADAVLGSGPHVLRGMELYKRRLIAYSLGNLSGWRNFGTGGTLSYSAVLTLELSPGGRLAGGRVTSLLLDPIGVPHRDPAKGAERLMRRLSRSDFGNAGVWFTLVGRL